MSRIFMKDVVEKMVEKYADLLIEGKFYEAKDIIEIDKKLFAEAVGATEPKRKINRLYRKYLVFEEGKALEKATQIIRDKGIYNAEVEHAILMMNLIINYASSEHRIQSARAKSAIEYRKAYQR